MRLNILSELGIVAREFWSECVSDECVGFMSFQLLIWTLQNQSFWLATTVPIKAEKKNGYVYYIFSKDLLFRVQMSSVDLGIALSEFWN